MENEIFKYISNIGYKGPLLDKNAFTKALQEGPKSIEFTRLVNYLTNELHNLCNIDECVNIIMGPEDSSSFLMEVSSFLKELGCQITALTQGHISDRLGTVKDRLLLLDHLIVELITARILQVKKPEKKIELKLQESSQAADLRKILQVLKFSKPPPNINMQMLFQKINPSLQARVQKANKELIGNAAFNGTLSEAQWDTLGKVQKDLHNDYTIRREMLLKRLDCTVQSFQWSDKTKGKDALIEKVFSEKRKALNVEPDVDLSDVLYARDDLAIIEKTSSASVRKNTQSSINKVIIGQVPDRGGRTNELAPPPPEMPPWQQRSTGPSSGGRGRGSGRGDSNYSRGGQQNSSFPRGGGSFGSSGGGNRGSFDSAGSYGGGNKSLSSTGNGGYSSSGNNYSSGGGSNYSSGGGSNYSSGGGGSNYYSGGSNYSSNDFQGLRNVSTSLSDYSRSGGSSSSRSTGGFDSAGSYGGHKSPESTPYNEPKRAKTYDQYQQNKTTYADRYVQESRQNQQYTPRDDRNKSSRGGRSNYSRGGYR